MRRLGEPERLGLVLGRLSKSAELGEAHDQPVAIVDRYRRGRSERLVDPVGGQRREVVGGQLDHPLVLAPVVVRLLEIGRGQDAESQVSEAPGDLQRAGAGHKRLVQLAEIEWVIVMRAHRPGLGGGRRSISRRAPRPRAGAPASAGLHRAGFSTGRSSRRISKPCSSVDGLSGSASRTPSACSNQTRASGSADRAAALTPACRR